MSGKKFDSLTIEVFEPDTLADLEGRWELVWQGKRYGNSIAVIQADGLEILSNPSTLFKALLREFQNSFVDIDKEQPGS